MRARRAMFDGRRAAAAIVLVSLVSAEAAAQEAKPADAKRSVTAAEVKDIPPARDGNLATAPSPIEAGTSKAAPGLPPLPPPPEAGSTGAASAAASAGTTAPGRAAAEKPAPGASAKDWEQHARRQRKELGPSATLSNVLAFRFTSTRLSGTPDAARYDSYQAAFGYDSSTTVFGLATRGTFAGGIGGGDGQPDGFIQGSFLTGVRSHPSQEQGFLARVGLAGAYAAGARFRRSWFEIPRGEVGYQVLNGRSLFELTGHGGLSVTGRWDGANPYVGRSTPVTFAWGGAMTVQIDPVRVAVDYTRTELTESGRALPIDDVGGHLCVNAFRALILCGEVAQTWGALPTATTFEPEVRALRLGFTLGFGTLDNTSPLKAVEPKKARDDDDDD